MSKPTAHVKSLSHPLVWGDADANETDAVLCERKADDKRYLMWYVGRITHDEVFPVLGDDGYSIIKPIKQIEKENGVAV